MSIEKRLTIRCDFPRPSREVLDALSAVSSSMACDAQDRAGALHHSIKPVTTSRRFVGPVLTVQTGPKDNLSSYAALSVAQPGDVVVITNGGFDGCAAVGDIYVGMARNAGVAACVTDGMARDVTGIEQIGLPVYARGTTPNSPFKNGPGSVGVPISIGGVSVSPGDIALADEDGVVIVPLAGIESFLEALSSIRAREAEMTAWVEGGRVAPPWLDDLLDAPGVDWH